MNLADIVVRAGAPQDLDQVMAVMLEAFDPRFGEAWNSGQCLSVLGLPGVALTLALAGDTPAAFTLARTVVDEAELLLIAVRHAWRGQGLGRALLDRTIVAAARSGAVRLLLEMREGNSAANLYSAAGFVEVGRRRDYYRGLQGACFDALTLARPLNRL